MKVKDFLQRPPRHVQVQDLSGGDGALRGGAAECAANEQATQRSAQLKQRRSESVRLRRGVGDFVRPP